MEITNQQLQQKFRDYLNGKTRLEWPLARVYYSQNGGFARRTGDSQTGVALSQSQGHIVISQLKIHQTEDSQPDLVEETQYTKLAIDKNSEVYHKTRALLEHAAHTQDSTETEAEPEPGDMYQ